MCVCDICPISHTPLQELKHPVMFYDNDQTVFEAKFIVMWLTVDEPPHDSPC